MAVKNFFKKVWSGIKKPFGFIKRKTEPAREFMRSGRKGGMILELILAALFGTWILYETAFGKIPYILCFLILAAIIFIGINLVTLALKIVFGAGKLCKLYFFAAALFVSFMNIISNQSNSIPYALGMSFLLTLAVDIIGRCIWAFVKTRKFKQVFAYVALVFSIAYIGAYVYFIKNDSFGEDRIAIYKNIPVSTETAAAGFDSYLQNGPYSVATVAYGPEETIVTETLDFSCFKSVKDRGGLDALFDNFSDYDLKKVPVKGQIWYPEGQKDCPVFFMVHGNHVSTVPSYMGYEYLAEYLASNGYVVISVDENVINATSEGNDKRAYLLLENMKVILEQNKLQGSPVYGLMDEDRIAIGGHSRGGEMVATAYMFNELDAYPEDGNIRFDYHYNITSIVAIAPVVDQYRPVSHSVEISDVNYLLIHGANDQDVSSMMGEKQYNNITFTGTSDEKYIKSSVYILGANHGQFNSLWGRYDMVGPLEGYLNTNHFLDDADQKLIAKAYIRTFLDSTLKQEKTYEPLLSDISAYRSYLPETVYLTDYEDSDFVKLMSFDDTVDIINAESGAAVSCSGSDNWTIKPYSRGNGGERENFVMDISWEKEQTPSVDVTFPAIDISNGSLSFEIADMRENTADKVEALSYKVVLKDGAGKELTLDNPVTVYPSLAIQFSRQDALFGEYEYKHQLQQVRIRPDMASINSDTAGGQSFDFSKVVAMQIIPASDDEGELIINNIGYWR